MLESQTPTLVLSHECGNSVNMIKEHTHLTYYNICNPCPLPTTFGLCWTHRLPLRICTKRCRSA